MARGYFEQLQILVEWALENVKWNMLTPYLSSKALGQWEKLSLMINCVSFYISRRGARNKSANEQFVMTHAKTIHVENV